MSRQSRKRPQRPRTTKKKKASGKKVDDLRNILEVAVGEQPTPQQKKAIAKAELDTQIAPGATQVPAPKKATGTVVSEKVCEVCGTRFTPPPDDRYGCPNNNCPRH